MRCRFSPLIGLPGARLSSVGWGPRAGVKYVFVLVFVLKYKYFRVLVLVLVLGF